MINNQEFNKWISAFETGEITNETLYVAQQDTIFEVNVADPDSAEWNVINYNLVVGSINCIRYDRAANRLWIGTDPGIYFLDIGDTVWTDYSTNLPNVEVTDIEIKDDKIFVGTYGRGVWYASAPECFVSGEMDTIDTNYTIIEGVTKTYKNDIFVESGYIFTEKGTLKMGADCRKMLKVERNS